MFAALSWLNRNNYSNYYSGLRFLWLFVILYILALATGLYAGYIKDNLLEIIHKYFDSHGFNSRGTITPTIPAVGHIYTIPIQHKSYVGKVSPPLSWHKLSAGIHYLVLMANDHVTIISINNGGGFSCW